MKKCFRYLKRLFYFRKMNLLLFLNNKKIKKFLKYKKIFKNFKKLILFKKIYFFIILNKKKKKLIDNINLSYFLFNVKITIIFL